MAKQSSTTRRPNTAAAAGTSVPIREVPLTDLHFDGTNPRFGSHSMAEANDEAILDEIVRRYGVEDVLSSIAANGYLPTEPLIGIQTDHGIRVIEGNRRLAALLILAGDSRAANQQRLQEEYRGRATQVVTAPPVAVYDEDAEFAQLLPYLGVKHIVGPKVWDSYAKATWMAGVLAQPDLGMTIEGIERMLGDTRGTIRRILEGYYLVEQLKEKGAFRPKDSLRKERGSNPEYPFSWVYNALDYSAIREWLGIKNILAPKPHPLPQAKLNNGGELMDFLFGNETKKKPAVIADSRQISDLAACLSKPETLAALRRGTDVERALKKVQPTANQLRDSLQDADDSLAEAWEVLGAAALTETDARSVEPLSGTTRKRATEIHKRVLEAMQGD
jgi:hypothetical protein